MCLKKVQYLYSTDAALLRIMQATLYLRAEHSVHVTRRLFSSRVHCNRNKWDGFEAKNSRPITLHGTLVLLSVGQCFFNLRVSSMYFAVFLAKYKQYAGRYRSFRKEYLSKQDDP